METDGKVGNRNKQELLPISRRKGLKIGGKGTVLSCLFMIVNGYEGVIT